MNQNVGTQAVQTIVDSGTTDTMVDRVTVKDQGLDVDPSQACEFTVASDDLGSFKSDGKTTQPVQFVLTSTEGEKMTTRSSHKNLSICDPTR